MLNQINHWIEYAAAAIDLVLLLRVLALRLQRTYLFLTLVCLLTVVFDVANLLYDSQAYPRVEIYGALFLSLLFPLAVWDIFEEIAKPVAAIRRLAMLRTVASLIIISLFGLLWVGSLPENEDPTGLFFISAITVTVSTGSATGCLGFLWIMRRGMTLQKVTPPKNTSVWMIFYALLMVAQLASWLVLTADQFLSAAAKEPFQNSVNVVVNSYGIVITLWCAVNLRGLSKDIPSQISETEPRP